MDKKENLIECETSLNELIDRVENYVPTWEDLVLKFTPEEREALGIENKGGADES